MNYNLVIVTDKNVFFSGVKTNSPKMYNAMKEIAVGYSKSFKKEFKVKRVIMTKTGWKFI